MHLPIKTPKFCPICKAGWKGGQSIPNEGLLDGKKTYFKCGAILTLRLTDEDTYKLTVKGCGDAAKPESNN